MPDDQYARAERLLTLSSSARRLSDLVAAADAPLRYEVLRHLLRVSEETMTEVLDEAVGAGLVMRATDPFTYVPASEALRGDLRRALDARLPRLQAQIAVAREHVLGDAAD